MLLMRAWGPGLDPLMLMMRALWGPPWRRKKPRKKNRSPAALASGLILLRRRPEASKAIPGTTRAKRSAFTRSFGDLALPDLMATASAADPLQGGQGIVGSVAGSGCVEGGGRGGGEPWGQEPWVHEGHGRRGRVREG